jgi:hypothetical protein
MPNTHNRVGQSDRQAIGTIAIALQQMKRYSLRRFLADARHAAQTVNQSNQ